MATYTKVVTVVGGVYKIGGGANASYALNEGDTIIFNLDDASLNGHPLAIGPTNNNDSDAYGASEGVTYTVDGVNYSTQALFESAFISAKLSTSTTPASVTYTASGSSRTIYYYCAVHSGMGNSLVITFTEESSYLSAGTNQTGYMVKDGITQAGLNTSNSALSFASGKNYILNGPFETSSTITVAGNLTVFNQLNVEGGSANLNVTGNLDIR